MAPCWWWAALPLGVWLESYEEAIAGDLDALQVAAPDKDHLLTIALDGENCWENYFEENWFNFTGLRFNCEY